MPMGTCAMRRTRTRGSVSTSPTSTQARTVRRRACSAERAHTPPRPTRSRQTRRPSASTHVLPAGSSTRCTTPSRVTRCTASVPVDTRAPRQPVPATPTTCTGVAVCRSRPQLHPLLLPRPPFLPRPRNLPPLLLPPPRHPAQPHRLARLSSAAREIFRPSLEPLDASRPRPLSSQATGGRQTTSSSTFHLRRPSARATFSSTAANWLPTAVVTRSRLLFRTATSKFSSVLLPPQLPPPRRRRAPPRLLPPPQPRPLWPRLPPHRLPSLPMRPPQLQPLPLPLPLPPQRLLPARVVKSPHPDQEPMAPPNPAAEPPHRKSCSPLSLRRPLAAAELRHVPRPSPSTTA